MPITHCASKRVAIFLGLTFLVSLSASWFDAAHADDRRSARRRGADITVRAVDLSSVSGDASSRRLSGLATVDLRNVGTNAAAGKITVTVFEDTNFSGTFEPGKDNVLGRDTLTGLGSNSSKMVEVAIDGQLKSTDHWLSAHVELEDGQAEEDVANNIITSGRGYSFEFPPDSALNPVLEWAWTHPSSAPNARNVMMTPAVADLNGDEVPDVVFGSTASRSGGKVEVGVLRAVSGRDGTEIFTVTDARYAINTGSSVAVGDLDFDGSVDIVACDRSGKHLIAFNSDGTFKWRSPKLDNVNWGEPQLVDLYDDGYLEVVLGRQVLNSDGDLLWTGEGGRGGGSLGSLVTLVDVDLDTYPEILAGNTLYGVYGEIIWQSGLTDGYTGSGEFDGDEHPEIVHVSKGKIRLLDHEGQTIWGPVRIPGGGSGGRPAIADLDGDGRSEVGVAGRDYYVVLDDDGSVMWKAKIQDHSSAVTSSAAFDFNQDGTLEVVYRDERFLRFYDGLTGDVLFQTPMSSGTWHEHPLVVDVDGDGEPEILAVANNNGGKGTQQGVFVFRDAGSDWRQQP